MRYSKEQLKHNVGWRLPVTLLTRTHTVHYFAGETLSLCGHYRASDAIPESGSHRCATCLRMLLRAQMIAKAGRGLP